MTTSDDSSLEPEHLKVIEALAIEFDCPKDEVKNLYISTLGSLKSSSRIKGYLNLLTSRKVRDMLSQNDKPHSPQV